MIITQAPNISAKQSRFGYKCWGSATRPDAITLHLHRRPPRDSCCCKDCVKTAQLLLTPAKTRCYCNKQNTTSPEIAAIRNQRLAAAGGDAVAWPEKSSRRHFAHESMDIIMGDIMGDIMGGV